MERRDRRRAGATVFSKRIHPSTLRFSKWNEAQRVVIEGNNRRVDGFVIKVFHARNVVETHSKSKGLDAFAHRKSLKGKEAFRDGRSFRDVVAGQPDKSEEPYEINSPLSEVDWLKRCLVGQLKDNESPNDDPDEDSRSLCNETQDAFNVEPPRNIVGEQLSHDELLDPRGEE
ncbi:hypothetical protein V6N11_074818 [Hibiscus sabdariffa]|uniref:Uncharacterized protein n=1 Tax=Hibiscus sabdariffa TaxID=183260 RepID=A0ABR2R4P3_9ROSI